MVRTSMSSSSNSRENSTSLTSMHWWLARLLGPLNGWTSSTALTMSCRVSATLHLVPSTATPPRSRLTYTRSAKIERILRGVRTETKPTRHYSHCSISRSGPMCPSSSSAPSTITSNRTSLILSRPSSTLSRPSSTVKVHLLRSPKHWSRTMTQAAVPRDALKTHGRLRR
jgi:hypothetical protein